METPIAHGNQERLGEKEHIPGGNGEAVDKIEAEHGRVDQPAAIASTAGDEPAKTRQHGHEKAGASDAVKPTVGLHFAPAGRVSLRLARLGISHHNTT